MEKHFFTAILVILSTFNLAFAKPPERANNAQIFIPEFCPFFVLVDPGPGISPIFPGDYGILITNLNAEGKLVVTRSGNGEEVGNLRLNCHSEVEVGSTYEGLDAITLAPVEGVVTPFDDACVTVNTVYPGTCKGDGTFVIKGENIEADCNVGGVLSMDWQEVVTKSGRISKICRATN